MRSLRRGPSGRQSQKKGTLRLTQRYLVSASMEGVIMTNRRGSATARLVPAMTPEQLFELTQEHIRPLIAVIDRLNEAGADEELRVIGKQLTRLAFRAQPLPSGKVTARR
jgi:hypothetical protein